MSLTHFVTSVNLVTFMVLWLIGVFTCLFLTDKLSSMVYAWSGSAVVAGLVLLTIGSDIRRSPTGINRHFSPETVERVWTSSGASWFLLGIGTALTTVWVCARLAHKTPAAVRARASLDARRR